VKAEHILPSFLARDIRDGRLGVQVNRYTARLMVRDADIILARFGPTALIYLHMGDVWTTTKAAVKIRETDLSMAPAIIETSPSRLL
jgi:hypothetical protein